MSCADPEPEVLPPLGEVVVAVDTDAPVPELVSRLRVDFFDAAGVWFDSRDILRADARDWPASFSVHSDDEHADKTLILRLRGYQDGRLRRYEGERSSAEVFLEPHAAQTLTELCDNSPELRLGEPLTRRRGRESLTGYVPTTECQRTSVLGGAIAATLRVTRAGKYRIETTRSLPSGETAGDTMLIVRRKCAELATQIACNDEASNDLSDQNWDHLSRLDLELEPGSYSVLAVGPHHAPADVTLKADLASAWHDSVEPSLEPPPEMPRLFRDGVDVTPQQEPQPTVTIDRLVQLRIVPGKKQLARVTLRTQCTGTMARLSSAGSFAELQPSEAQTCLEHEAERRPLADEPLSPFHGLLEGSRVGRFGLNEPCEPESSSEARVCIPGGQFVLGVPTARSISGRFAIMHRFWMDRTEVTVERWRAATMRGFVPRDLSPLINDWAYATSFDDSSLLSCTYSTEPLPAPHGRERHPLNCTNWYDARDFCQFEGGELPSEAQWEYAAARAGRDRSGRFPWLGETDGAIDCDQAVIARFEQAGVPSCGGRGFGVASIDDPAYGRDATPLGVLGLGGSLSEWVLDAWAETLDAGCWLNSTLTDPLCWEKEATKRSFRGGSAFDLARSALIGERVPVEPLGASANGLAFAGFRCVYEAPP